MAPDELPPILDAVIKSALGEEETKLLPRINSTAAQALKLGIGGSQMADFMIAKAYHDHFKTIADRVWSEIKRVLEEISFEPDQAFAPSMFSYVQRALNGPYEQCRKAVYDRLQESGITTAPKPSIGEYRESIEDKLKAEILVLCAKLRAKEKLSMKNTNLYVVSGPNARVNVGSTDNSTNVVNETQLFTALREALSAKIQDRETKAKALELVETMEKNPRTSKYVTAYARFTQLLANHVQVLQPFLPALSDLLQ